MTKLLSANFLRLWKNKTFWVSAIICVASGVLAPLGEFRAVVSMNGGVTDLGELGNLALPEVFFGYASFIGILAGAFISLFLGTEYSDGTIRNKVMAGHSRVAIYFANLIVGFTASLVCMAAYMASCLAVGAPLLGWFSNASLILTTIFGSVLMLAAFCAIFTFVTMNVSRKSTSVVICLLGVFIMLFLAVYLYARLDEPEFIQDYSFSVGGEILPMEPEPNPQYLRGMEREVYQFIFDLLPTGQSIQYNGLIFTDPVRLMVMSLALFVGFSGAGAALFRRKDLK